MTWHGWKAALLAAGTAILACSMESGGSAPDAGLPDSGFPDGGPPDAGPPLGAPGNYTRTLAAWPSRSYDVHVPPSYDGFTPLPVVFALHGGGGNRAGARTLACPRGDRSDPGCLDPLADARGLIMVYPDGTGAPLAPDARTWNAGGGDGGWQCVSGIACTQGVDELAYFTALLADLQTAFQIDRTHLFSTGISNGGAMSQRLACSLAGIAAVAPVAGENQYATTESCSPAVSVLEIHGTADPCWSYNGGEAGCLDKNPGAKVGVPASIGGWIARNGCDPTPTDVTLPNSAADGTTTVQHIYRCSGAALQLYEVVDGGHTWPGGYQYSSASLIGLTSYDFSASEVILDFFAAHRRFPTRAGHAQGQR